MIFNNIPWEREEIIDLGSKPEWHCAQKNKYSEPINAQCKAIPYLLALCLMLVITADSMKDDVIGVPSRCYYLKTRTLRMPVVVAPDSILLSFPFPFCCFVLVAEITDLMLVYFQKLQGIFLHLNGLTRMIFHAKEKKSNFYMSLILGFIFN